ncbi:MAG: MAPEG family protein [Pseudomonadota bacterium]
MSVELQSLFGVAAILLALVLLQGALIPATYGFKWGLGARDEPREPTALLGRMRRIIANHLEGMAMFVPLILIAHFAGISTPLTQWGAVLFVAGRAAFAVIYMMGVPVLRSAAWGVALTGLLMVGFDVVRLGF